jgi:hypothetical protein
MEGYWGIHFWKYGIAMVEKNRAGGLSLVESSYCGTD